MHFCDESKCPCICGVTDHDAQCHPPSHVTQLCFCAKQRKYCDNSAAIWADGILSCHMTSTIEFLLSCHTHSEMFEFCTQHYVIDILYNLLYDPPTPPPCAVFIMSSLSKKDPSSKYCEAPGPVLVQCPGPVQCPG